MAEDNSFKIGLCMAGAISAGAYTAGVMDYLIEALEEWQKRKDADEPNTPSHKVQIAGMGGASAGGMTSLMAAAAFDDVIEPVKEAQADLLAPRPENKFYHSWVDLTQNEMLGPLLDTKDIEQAGLSSMLNANFIDQIAQRALKASGDKAPERAYIAPGLRVFVSLSNLKGMDFSLSFRSNSPNFSRYLVSSHIDYACFRLVAEEGDYRGDGWIPLNFKTGLNRSVAQNAAMATGAFPVGLKARKLKREARHMNEHSWFDQITKLAQKPFGGEHYQTTNVDGGMINNEPFEKLRELLMEETKQDKAEDYQSYDRFKSTILMIDPFPSEPKSDFNDDVKLSAILPNTLGAMLGQARLKSSSLLDAMDSNLAGQYLIAPVRYQEAANGTVAIEASKAIACGALGGFGGFISKEFRIHDYFLGRANCEKFLRDHFTVPADTENDIFKAGYAGITDLSQFKAKDGSLQIIPIFSDSKPAAYMPSFANGQKWPSVSTRFIRGHRKAIKARAQKLMFALGGFSKLQKALLWIGAKVVLNNKIAEAVIEAMENSLKDHRLLK